MSKSNVDECDATPRESAEHIKGDDPAVAGVNGLKGSSYCFRASGAFGAQWLAFRADYRDWTAQKPRIHCIPREESADWFGPNREAV